MSDDFSSGFGCYNDLGWNYFYTRLDYDTTIWARISHETLGGLMFTRDETVREE